MGYMVHYTPDSVLSTKSYQMWMKSFGTQCLHLVANGNGEALPISDGIYRQQQMLTAVCPDLFPSISGQEFRGVVTQVNILGF
jgi:hypothetical protein